MKPLILALILTISWAAYAQQSPCPEETVLVEAYGPQGLPAQGLKSSNFRAKHRGKTLRILKAMPWSGPARVVLLFDLSGSDVRSVPIEKSVGLDIVRQAPAGMSLAMAVFGSQAKVVAPFSAGTATVENQVGNLDALAGSVPKRARKTALYDAVEFAVGMFGHPRSGDAVCLISDGWDNASQISLQQTERILLANEVRLFAVVVPGLRIPRGLTPEGNWGPGIMRHLAETSGGVQYILQPSSPFERRLPPADWPETTSHVPPAFDQVITRGYQLDISVRRAVRKPERWKLEVVDSKGKVDHHHFLAYPLLKPCKMNP